MTVRVVDEGKPVRSAEVTVKISVTRNKHMPAFTSSSYQQAVSENTGNTSGILTVVATDKDLQGAINYELVGVAPAPSYFSVGRTTGYVYVIKDLKLDRALTYTVSIHVCACMYYACIIGTMMMTRMNSCLVMIVN